MTARHEPPLQDRFGRKVSYLRVSVTDRCNFRCVYCMPAEGLEFLKRSRLLSYEELARIIAVFARGGVRKIRLTGGEPTLRSDLAKLIEKVDSIDGIEQIAMTTNGYLLDRQADSLYRAGLRHLNISLDSLRPDRFEAITRVGNLAKVEAGIDAAMRAGFDDIKINAVIVRGFNDDEIVDLTEWALERKLVLRFIEFMPIGGEALGWKKSEVVSANELRMVLATRYELKPKLELALGAGPARYWEVSGESGVGRVGFISAVTNCFCAGCNRMRLTPEGKLRACLADDREVDLRTIVRNGGDDETIRLAIETALLGKRETHRFVDGVTGGTTRSMTTIGG